MNSKMMVCALMLIAVMTVAGCTSKTEYGECIGAFDDKTPGLIYKVSVWNVFLGVFFFELIAPPIYVIVDETLCPIGKVPQIS